MKRASYGLYGSRSFFVIVTLAALTSAVAIGIEFHRTFFFVSFIASVLLLGFVPMAFGRSRMRMVPKIIDAAAMRSGALVLDVGIGRGFPAIEIAKAVPGCRIIGIDVWEQRAAAQLHQGWITGNTRDRAIRNAVIEGVQDRVEFRQCDVRELPFEANSFDVVVSFVVLHQVLYFATGGERALRTSA